jgi:RNA polymerase sigma-54 factor
MGYIRRSVPDMVDDMAFTQAFTPMKDGAKMLQIHELEPSGCRHKIYKNACCYN